MKIRFKLTDRKYITSDGQEVTADMLVGHPHEINRKTGWIEVPDDHPLSPGKPLSLPFLRNKGFKDSALEQLEISLNTNLLLSYGHFPFNAAVFALVVVDDDGEYVTSIQCPPINTEGQLNDFLEAWHGKAVDLADNL